MRLSFVCMLSLAAASCLRDARAGASLFVDDAAVTPARRCQVESWVRDHRVGMDFNAVPACNVGGSEFGLGMSRQVSPSAGPVFSPGIKRLFRDFDTHQWGLGASIGASWDGGSRRFDGWSLNVPVSVALVADKSAVLHANLGWSKPRAERGMATGGVGIEWALAGPWTLLGEGYCDARGTVVSQLGLRRALGDVASLDVLLGHEGGDRHDRWVTLGLNVALPE